MTPPKTDVHSEDVAYPVEAPMGDQPERVEEIQQVDFTPTPTVEQRRFSAPQSDWDPAR
jgi:glycogenin